MFTPAGAMTIRPRHLPWAFVVSTIALQIPYPLLHGQPRRTVTVASVVTFAVATLAHVLVTRGPAAAARLLAGVWLLAFGVEVLGVHTGYPFGTYRYSDGLGPALADVPLLVPLAWVMMAWPAIVAARRLVTKPVLVPVLTSLALTGWDLFLDPQMVEDRHWSWSYAPGSPALQGIPLTNLLGWMIAGLVVGVVADRAVPTRSGEPEADQALPLALFGWTYLGSVVANAVFLGREGVALSGGLGMGLVAIPLLWILATGRRSIRHRTPGQVRQPPSGGRRSLAAR